MKYKQSILKFASLLLIVVLTQKMVGGLYLHNWLHGSKNIVLHSSTEKAISQLNCSCIDDFYVPFTEPDKVVIETPASPQAVFFAVPETTVLAVSRLFHSLRGPPVA